MKKESNNQLDNRLVKNQMIVGFIIAVILGAIIQFFTGNQYIWSWVIPFGVSAGMMAQALQTSPYWILRKFGMTGFTLLFILINSIQYFFSDGTLVDLIGVTVLLTGISIGVSLNLTWRKDDTIKS